ncbi:MULTISPECIES: hypothetical protein [Limnospira]|uniref:Uncharacterized protein n=3 Tax=Limnospira platensis TaxID=118562 RepID=A0A5M3TE50_LIMPL|nr:hypothetical protein [Arthrospira platensis]AMW29285.1 hypothetical protein AP285_16265 [Arthrospira platensis YZ]KDR57662.1 hypothetical protein APPUASWS_009740 [Arthrospira platensis str. Paraca]MBD2671609.1 hypothetical protein [Arthrospira platensis FACHB-439]MBD2713022.1 hypothetical protein [Arthrospira platensis FACHB-835]MDF2213172.1 hypothetical protein [Arthrospira platensis NCB002]MDT9185634.1 hypothetical protein [Limnospira sp. PMC 289.06]MDT9313317.1 hypothetical protein [Li
MYPLKEITLQLFLYDLREGLGQTSESIDFNRYYFWRRFHHDLEKPYSKLTAENLDKLEKYATKENPEIDIVSLDYQEGEQPLMGIEYVLAASQLGDSYSLIIDAYDSEYQKTSLKQLKTYIQERIINSPSSLGQTWLLWGQLDRKYSPEKVNEIAEKSYKEIANNQLSFPANQLLGGYLFEISQFVSVKNWENLLILIDNEKPEDLRNYPRLNDEHKSLLKKDIQNSLGECHYLIWLLPAECDLTAIQEEIKQIQTHFHRLLSYRHKIIWAYSQSRILKRRLKKNYQTIQKSVLTIRQQRKQPEDLQEALEETLEILGNYAIDLSQLHSQLRTITINLANYRQRLKEFAKVDPNCELTTLAEFSKLAATKYERQVKTDYESLSPGMILLENLIKTIEGIVEINQAKREDRLERAIAAASIGVGTASAAASSIANYSEGILTEIASFVLLRNKTEAPTIHPVSTASLTFVISCVIGLILGWLTWWRLNSRPG